MNELLNSIEFHARQRVAVMDEQLKNDQITLEEHMLLILELARMVKINLARAKLEDI